jgi:hypothetical protein
MTTQETAARALTDGEAIMQLMTRYALAIDTKRWELLDLSFAPDAQIDFVGQKWSDLDSWRHDWDLAHRKFDATMHVVTNIDWHVSGDTGNAISYGHFHLVTRNSEANYIVYGGAWYDDELRMTDDGWRISSRICGVTWVAGDPTAPEYEFLTPRLSAMSTGVGDGTLRFVGALGA